jgi:hypothetical protein
MITPSYSVTATERVLPRLALDFTTGVLDPRVTLTRALNTATRFNSSGLIEIINANLPRFDYNPTTLLPLGLLIEESRANALINAVLAKGVSLPTDWKQSVGGGTQDTTASIYGNLDGAYAWAQTAANERPFFIPNTAISVSANTSYFLSMYLETNPNSIATQNILSYASIPSGTATYYINGVASTGSTVPTAPCRLGVLFAIGATGGTVNPRIGLGGQASVTGTIKFSRPQWETGAFATSYIPTTTTSLTRNADAVSMTDTNFSDWYNATEGTLQVIGSMNTASTTVLQMFAMLGDANNGLQIFNNLSASRFRGDIYSGGALQKAFTYTAAGAPASGTTYNIIVGLKVNDFAMAVNGNTVATANSNLMPVSPSALYIGSVNTGFQQLGGHVRKLSYYKQKLTNAEIQAFSK